MSSQAPLMLRSPDSRASRVAFAWHSSGAIAASWEEPPASERNSGQGDALLRARAAELRAELARLRIGGSPQMGHDSGSPGFDAHVRARSPRQSLERELEYLHALVNEHKQRTRLGRASPQLWDGWQRYEDARSPRRLAGRRQSSEPLAAPRRQSSEPLAAPPTAEVSPDRPTTAHSSPFVEAGFEAYKSDGVTSMTDPGSQSARRRRGRRRRRQEDESAGQRGLSTDGEGGRRRRRRREDGGSSPRRRRRRREDGAADASSPEEAEQSPRRRRRRRREEGSPSSRGRRRRRRRREEEAPAVSQPSQPMPPQPPQPPHLQAPPWSETLSPITAPGEAASAEHQLPVAAVNPPALQPLAGTDAAAEQQQPFLSVDLPPPPSGYGVGPPSTQTYAKTLGPPPPRDQPSLKPDQSAKWPPWPNPQEEACGGAHGSVVQSPTQPGAGAMWKSPPATGAEAPVRSGSPPPGTGRQQPPLSTGGPGGPPPLGSTKVPIQ
eukprot:TRINITY_DN8298_c2_g1_i1.p1 TRINITY_DN8298_c2_g1~~TRINITY_DN8298_c2_g1_i1.p1  ORF type:complete len:512 (+),score=164.11 TRINITY_DN8298_c2_g1_i1:59-1537(+)